MTDFNKGDFTQQGVDGHVNAKLRLNAKRYLDIDLTSNEQASGCTISGHVYDSLNNITYPIGSAPSGNIEITENGENINVAPYATATVNVSGGGGDFTTAQVTIINPTENNYALPIPNAHEQQGMRPAMTVNNITVPANDSVNVVVPLYYNACYISLAHNEGSFASCTGDLTINSSIDLFIKGDGTVTLASL